MRMFLINLVVMAIMVLNWILCYTTNSQFDFSGYPVKNATHSMLVVFIIQVVFTGYTYLDYRNNRFVKVLK